MRKEKEVEKFYNVIAKRYERYNKRFCDEILEYFILKYLPKKPKRKLKILDAGGGIGRFAIPLAKNGHQVVLSDISEKMLDKAEKISKRNKIKNIEFVKESITNMKSEKTNSFDVVIAMNAILDYCGNYKKALKEISRVLKSKGLFIGSVNNRFVYAASHELLKLGDAKFFKESMKTGDRYISWGGTKKGHWTHEFTLKELSREIEKANFKIIKILGVFNLVGKYMPQKFFKDKERRKQLFDLQIEYAQNEDYINNSSDYFFVVQKK